MQPNIKKNNKKLPLILRLIAVLVIGVGIFFLIKAAQDSFIIEPTTDALHDAARAPKETTIGFLSVLLGITLSLVAKFITKNTPK